jgi:hypothetical protein
MERSKSVVLDVKIITTKNIFQNVLLVIMISMLIWTMEEYLIDVYRVIRIALRNVITAIIILVKNIHYVNLVTEMM